MLFIICLLLGSQGSGGRNYSVGSADRGGGGVDRRDSGAREGVRRGSTGGSGGGKRYEMDKRYVGQCETELSITINNIN